MFRKYLTKEQAYQKIKHFCAYQERSHFETKDRLYSLGLRKADVEELLSKLVEENMLNEERFALQFARGKFRLKQWGKVKIIYELRQKKVSDYCIKKALKEIDETEYEKILKKLARQKWKSIKSPGVNDFVKMSKATSYLLQKGFESALVKAEIQTLQKNEDGYSD
jgi:regulatory protein